MYQIRTETGTEVCGTSGTGTNFRGTVPHRCLPGQAGSGQKIAGLSCPVPCPSLRKRVNLSMEEKLWIIRQKEENKKISHPRLALDFLAKFNRSITRACISKTLKKSEEILALANKNPELETQKTFKLPKSTIGAVVKTLMNKFNIWIDDLLDFFRTTKIYSWDCALTI